MAPRREPISSRQAFGQPQVLEGARPPLESVDLPTQGCGERASMHIWRGPDDPQQGSCPWPIDGATIQALETGEDVLDLRFRLRALLA